MKLLIYLFFSMMGILTVQLVRGVIIVKSEEANQVIEFLEKKSAQYHIRVVELSKEDCIALGLSTK